MPLPSKRSSNPLAMLAPLPLAAVLACGTALALALTGAQPLWALLPAVGLGASLGAALGLQRGRAQAAAAALQMLRPAGDALPTPGPAHGPARQGGAVRETGALDCDALCAPAWPALQPVADAVRTLLVRQQALFDVQAEQLEDLRRQAHADPLTGLANRRHFLAMLDALLDGGQSSVEAGLLLLRLHDLQLLNEGIGPAAADRALLAIAEALQAYADRVPRCVAGRMNGADFALLLPVGGVAHETAQVLEQALRRPLAAIGAEVRLHAAAVELGLPTTAAQALDLAGAALSQRAQVADALAAGPVEPVEPAAVPDVPAAMPGVPTAVPGALAATPGAPSPLSDDAIDLLLPVAPAAPVLKPLTPTSAATAQAAEPVAEPVAEPATAAVDAEAGWQRRIARALVQGQVALASYPVVAADGRPLHLDCPLTVQLEPGGPFEPAARWLGPTARARLTSVADERALVLALDAIGADGQGRCINFASASVASPDFVSMVVQRLDAVPQAACRLWIDLPESLALKRPLLVRELSRRWRPLGPMLGLEHAGEALARIPGLIDLGLDCVRIDARFVHGIAEPGAADARRHLQGLVRLVQAVGLQVCAEGVRQAADLDMLWQLGFDAVTGPAITAAAAPAPPAAAPAAAPSAFQHQEPLDLVV